MNSSPSDESLTSTRVSQLESTVAHQQHAYDGLNEVVIEQAKIIESLQRRVQKLESILEDLRHQDPGEARDFLAEKPPHY